MKKVKICFLDFWEDFDVKRMKFYLVLCERYNVEIVSSWQRADYIFYSCFGETHWAVTKDKIKIFFTAENITPDFNACDYAIGFDYLDFGDRYLRQSNYYSINRGFDLLSLNRDSVPDNKKRFCAFVVSNGYASEYRVRLFEQLSKYKRVDSGGRFMNNIGGPVNDKREFDAMHKFSICCENSSHPGYTTEKLYQAFEARTIPIYWGDPEVSRVFNTRAFINANDSQSVEEVVKRVIEIDQNEELYHRMLREPIFVDEIESSIVQQEDKLRRFLFNIFDQDIESAYRYNRHPTHFTYTNKMSEICRLSRMPYRKLIFNIIKLKLSK